MAASEEGAIEANRLLVSGKDKERARETERTRKKKKIKNKASARDTVSMVHSVSTQHECNEMGDVAFAGKTANHAVMQIPEETTLEEASPQSPNTRPVD